MSSIFAWNMRGFNKPRKQRAVRYWVQAARLSFACLLETKVKKENFQKATDRKLLWREMELVATTMAAGGVSDHLRMWTQLRPSTPTNRKPFKFFTHVINHPQFLEVVATDSPTTEAFEEVSAAWEHWHHISGIEEQLYFQKSRVKWLGLGDGNNCFYHNVCKARNSKNTIRRIITSDGRILTDLNEIKAEAVKHFDTFLNEQPNNLVEVSQEYLQDVIDYRYPQEAAMELVSPESQGPSNSVLQGLL
ncbi:Endonuclease/exonuclease/phosphatase protein [Raphanus sativus]|nr:Endonuclease/exonuclease/phosphatase protein [Raphanus sativus]